MIIRISLVLCTFLASWVQITAAMATESSRPLVLGQSAALSGPAQNLGLEMRAGLLAAFSLINDHGGIKGREVVLLSRDDGYEPDIAVRNTRAFIADDQVFALIGAVGTPTAKAVVPIINEARIPFFGPFTGAEILRSPFQPYIINVRASYYEELEKLASYLVDNKKFRRIACFYQNDSYGYDGLRGIEIALAKRGMTLVSQGSYERNTVAVMGALQDIYEDRPEVVVLVGAYAACAEFIKLSKNKVGGNITFCNISFVGTESLREVLGGYGLDVVVSQVVPYPNDSDIELTREYKRAMAKYQHDSVISFTSLEGYIGGKLFGEIARAVEGELTREKFIATMEAVGKFDLGGLILQFGPKDHQGMDAIYLTRIYPAVRRLENGE
ncbi:MAG: ABC transporter substrate-binding protein [Proteobacteria bacterium]|nr:ABC transporter substrate-binding protein [Pseudomonadota bacterium]